MTTTHAGPAGPDEVALAAATSPEPEIVTCDACPVLCRIRAGKTGACDRVFEVVYPLSNTHNSPILLNLTYRQ